jgi:hypothetical protein
LFHSYFFSQNQNLFVGHYATIAVLPLNASPVSTSSCTAKMGIVSYVPRTVGLAGTATIALLATTKKS